MRKAAAMFFLLLIGFPILLYAQEEDEPSVEPDWDFRATDAYARGDQTFNISLGVVFPIIFVNQGKKIEHNFTPPVGGIGNLSYNYFLNSHIFVGGEIGGIFMPTLGKSTAFIIPLGARVGYQFLVWRLEIPLSLSMGMAWHRYLNLAHYGFYIKGGASVFYRFNSNWSFGLNANWYWLPEWTREKEKNVHGNVLDLTLSARYHF